MKKISIIFVLMMITVLTFTGCNKDSQSNDFNNKDNNSNDGASSSVVGSSTNWQGIEWSKVDKEPILMYNDSLLRVIGSDRHSEFGGSKGYSLLSQVTKIHILDTTIDKIPQDYKYTWDVSAKEDGSVNAWLVENGTMNYELYLGGDYGIILNKEEVMIGTTNSIFRGYENCTEIEGLNKIDVSRVKIFDEMFRDCEKITNLDLSTWKTSSAESMVGMFENCKNLENLKLNNFSTGNVTNMERMFLNCNNLKKIDLNNFDTQKVESMNLMFCGCERLTSLDLNSFDTSSVKYMYAMFSDCSSLSNLKVGKFNIENVIVNCDMFDGCSKLEKKEEIIKFDTDNLKSFAGKIRGYEEEKDGTLILNVEIDSGKILVGDTLEIIDDKNKVMKVNVTKLEKFGNDIEYVDTKEENTKMERITIEKNKSTEVKNFITDNPKDYTENTLWTITPKLNVYISEK